MIRTGEQYRDSIRDGRQVWINGERVKDVTTHPDVPAPGRCAGAHLRQLRTVSPFRKHRRFVRGFMSIACMIVASMTRTRDRRAVDRRLSVIQRSWSVPVPTRLGRPDQAARHAVESQPPRPKMLAHRPRPQRSARAAHARGWNHEIAGDQLEPLVFAREASLAQGMDRGTGRGLVPEPVAELPARRLAEAGGRCFEVVSFHIIDGETQQQRRRERLPGALITLYRGTEISLTF